MILTLCLLLSCCFDSEDISNTRDSVSSAIQTLSSKNTLMHVVFSILFLVFGYPYETLSLGLIYMYYFKDHLKVLLWIPYVLAVHMIHVCNGSFLKSL